VGYWLLTPGRPGLRNWPRRRWSSLDLETGWPMLS